MMDLLADLQSGHSAFQMDAFIVQSGNWTPYGRYMQALRELDKRRRGGEELRFQREQLHLDIEANESRWCWTAAGNRKRALELERLRFGLAECERKQHETARELRHFLGVAQSLKDELGELTPEKRAALESETWEIRARTMAAIDVATIGSVSHATGELIAALPDDMRRRCIGWLKQGREAVAGFLESA